MIAARFFFISRDRQAAQPVVGAERDDQDPHVPLRAPSRAAADPPADVSPETPALTTSNS